METEVPAEIRAWIVPEAPGRTHDVHLLSESQSGDPKRQFAFRPRDALETPQGADSSNSPGDTQPGNM